jgi:hypothetical protein
MALEKELEKYNKELDNFLLHHAGKYVLIIGDEVKGFFDGYEDALREGYKIVKSNPFFVRKIQGQEQAYCFTRPITPYADNTLPD